MKKIKVMTIFGTRPEAIKMNTAPGELMVQFVYIATFRNCDRKGYHILQKTHLRMLIEEP